MLSLDDDDDDKLECLRTGDTLLPGFVNILITDQISRVFSRNMTGAFQLKYFSVSVEIIQIIFISVSGKD